MSDSPQKEELRKKWVPCGRCEECLRQQRNDWYVRLERETKYQKSLHRNSVFVTITIAPEYYDSALLNPSAFIRMWFERVRRRSAVLVFLP